MQSTRRITDRSAELLLFISYYNLSQRGSCIKYLIVSLEQVRSSLRHSGSCIKKGSVRVLNRIENYTTPHVHMCVPNLYIIIFLHNPISTLRLYMYQHTPTTTRSVMFVKYHIIRIVSERYERSNDARIFHHRPRTNHLA